MGRPSRPLASSSVLAATLLLSLGLVVAAPAARAGGYPTPLPKFDREFLSNLSAPSVAPGGSTTLGFRLSDPATFGNLSHVVLTLAIYALNGYPGDDVALGVVANAPVLVNLTTSGPNVTVSTPGGSLENGTSFAGTVAVQTSGATPAGTYAVRTELSFVENHTDYLFKSRGWFNESLWQNATELPNGSGTLNLSRLGVSGVVPETAVYVAPSDWPIALGALVAVGVILVGLGAWLQFRKGPGSRSGAANPPAPEPTNAPSALGRSRNKPGDSRSS